MESRLVELVVEGKYNVRYAYQRARKETGIQTRTEGEK